MSSGVMDREMAKKQAGRPGPKPVDGGRVAATIIRSTERWKEWLEGLSRFDAKQQRAKVNISDTADRAFVAYARSIGYQAPPPTR
jgi:hypothetical protein